MSTEMLDEVAVEYSVILFFFLSFKISVYMIFLCFFTCIWNGNPSVGDIKKQTSFAA